MWSSIKIENFKCLRNVTAPLAPLTVLIGKNDTGKSSLLDAIHSLAQLTRGNNEHFRRPRSVADLLTRDSGAEEIRWTVEVSPTARNRLPGVMRYSASARDGGGSVEVSEERLSFLDGVTTTRIERIKTPSGPGQQSHAIFDGPTDAGPNTGGALPHNVPLLGQLRHSSGFPILASAARCLTATMKYRFDPRRLALPTAIPRDGTPSASRLDYDGEGLALVLGELAERRSPELSQIEKELRSALPSLDGLTTPTLYEDPPKRALGFRLATGGVITAPLASEGALLYLAYLTLAHSPDLPSVLLIEEPENGIHPQRLQQVILLLKSLTAAERGESRVQVVMTTHSPYLLDFVEPEGVLVFGRGADGGTIVRPILELPLYAKRRKAGYTLGETWFNFGEEALLHDKEAPCGS